MPTTPVNVEEFIAEGGLVPNLKLVIETAKQVGLSTEFNLVEARNEGINVVDRARKDTLLKCEDTIREAISEIIQNKTPIVNALKDEKFCGSHLENYPQSYTGIFLYYLCKGLYEDFGIWFKGTPVSLKKRETQDKMSKSYNDGGRVITNKAARDLRKAADMNTYMPDITAGKMSMDDAITKMKEAVEEMQKLTSLGIKLPTTATGKVRYFSEEVEARADKEKPDDRYTLFKKEELEIKVPRVQDDLEFKVLNHRKYKTDINNIVKSGNPLNHPELIKIERETGALTAKDILLKSAMALKEVNDMDASAEIINCHIVKSKKKGTGRQRFICFDCQSKTKGQFLVFTNEDAIVSIVES